MAPSILLFGATSILGYHLAQMFSTRILPFIAPGNNARSVRHWPMLGLGDRGWVEGLSKQHQQPALLLYCHAVCDVPKCEAAPGWAREINVGSVRRVVDALPEQTRLVGKYRG